MGGSQADIAGIAAIAEIAHERQKNKFCRQKVNEGRWAGKSKIIISICRGVMYGPDIVLHSENMAVPAMQENSQKGTDKNAEKPRFDGINMEAILSKNEAEHGSTRMDKATWTAFHTAMLMKYSLAELEKIGEQARKLKVSDFSNLGGKWGFPVAPTWETIDSEDERKDTIVAWLCAFDMKAPLVTSEGTEVVKCPSLALMLATARVCGRVTLFESVEEVQADLFAKSKGPVMYALDGLLVQSQFWNGGVARSEGSACPAWGSVESPAPGVTALSGVLGESRQIAESQLVGALCLSVFDDDEEDEEELEKAVLESRVEALRTPRTSDAIDGVIKQLKEKTLSKPVFMTWLEGAEKKMAAKAAKLQAAMPAGFRSGRMELSGAMMGEMGPPQGLGAYAASGGVGVEGVVKGVERPTGGMGVMQGSVFGGLQSNMFTGNLSGGMYGSGGMGSDAEKKKLQSITMRDNASVSLRDKASLREMSIQSRIMELEKEHERRKEKVLSYPEEYKMKAELQLNQLWTVELRATELACDVEEAPDSEVWLLEQLRVMIQQMEMQKSKCLEYLFRIGQAVKMAREESEMLGSEFLRAYEEQLKGAAAKDSKGEQLRKEAERRTNQKRKLQAQESTIKQNSQMNSQNLQLVAHYQQQLSQQKEWVGNGKLQRTDTFDRRGGGGGKGGMLDRGAVGNSFRPGGMMGERRPVEWVDAGVWSQELAGAMAPKPGTFTADRRYNFDSHCKGVVNPQNDGRMTCDICGQVGHAAAECGRGYTGQPMEFQREGKRHLTWVFLNDKKLCNAFGRKLQGRF